MLLSLDTDLRHLIIDLEPILDTVPRNYSMGTPPNSFCGKFSVHVGSTLRKVSRRYT
jgi:hypothetical protein